MKSAMSLRRIAQVAGVSFSSVSLALQDSPRISEKTKQRIRQLARDLNYRPNPKVAALMRELRVEGAKPVEACLGVIALYDNPRPWEHRRIATRTFEGMKTRAAELGYRLEPFWLRAPGMNMRRFRAILDARGIEGLLCFGSSDFAEKFPMELDHYAVVTIGLSIQTPLHRVTSHFYADTARVLDKLYKLGYRRPGLVVGRAEEVRCHHAYISAYLGWCEYTLGEVGAVPVLRLDADTKPLTPWLRRYRPDALVLVHLHDRLPAIETTLREWGVRVPEDIGVAVVSTVLEGTRYSGVEPNRFMMGARAVELVASNIMQRELVLPTVPKIEMVEGHWVDGQTVRAQSKSVTREAARSSRRG